MPGLLRAKSSVELSAHARKTRTEEDVMVQTSLYLPTPASANGDEKERLVLPRDEPFDVYLSRIPQVRSKAEELCDQAKQDTTEAAFLQKARSGRCLNVLQGEVAHASALQTDILVSAEATTCHVVALRSTRKSKSATVPLVSLAHVDQAGVYDNCLDAMVQQHLKHHSSDQTKPNTQAGAANPINPDDSEEDEDFFFYNEDEDTRPQEEHDEKHARQQSFLPPSTPSNLPRRSSSSMPSLHDDDDEEPIEMELHMVGGYLDKEGTSQDISHSLITSFSELAKKYQDQVRISLTTALISSLNTTNAANEASSSVAPKPKSRGLGIDTQTGQVFPITDSLPPELEGPGLDVRTARSLARATSSPNLMPRTTESLHVIHDNNDGHIRVQPYDYRAVPGLDALLHVPDDVLLQVSSTSPDCESGRFCSNLRRAVSFLNTSSSEQVFEDRRPLVYSRSAQDLNRWELVSSS